MESFTLTGPRPGQVPKKKVALKSILEQKDKRYPLETSIGDIELKYPGAVAIEDVSLRMIGSSPEIAKAMDESQLYFEMSENGIPYSEADTKRMEELSRVLKPLSNAMSALCFVEPEITEPSELDALFDALKSEERTTLRVMLATLTKPLSRGEVDEEMVKVYLRFGIPLFPNASVIDLTRQQRDLLVNIANSETEALNEQANRLQ